MATSEVNSQTLPIVWNLVAAIFGALGQYLYKVGASRLGSVPLFKNWPLFLGASLFCGVMLCFVIAFKLGGKLSVTYPVYATTFVWGLLLAKFFVGEDIALVQIAGVVLILAGVGLIALKS